jgi:hypothetical protein
VERSIKLIYQREERIPKKLKRLEIPILDVKSAIARLKANKNARPGHVIKKAIQDKLHSDYTFQGTNQLFEAMEMIGIGDFWNSVTRAMPSNPTKATLQKKLNSVAKRRNQIVHEADVVRKIRAKKLSLRDIQYGTIKNEIIFIDEFIKAVHSILP